MEKKYFCVLILFIGLCHGVSRASECTARGRFPNDETDDCRGYTMCLLGGLTNFTQYKLMCPMGSVYSHLEAQCTNSTNYKCVPTYNCSSVGNFVNTESTDCASYVACIAGLGGVGTARLIECPPNTLFNSTVCVSNSEFNCSSTKISVNLGEEEHVVRLPHNNTINNAMDINVKCSFLFSLCLLLSVL